MKKLVVFSAFFLLFTTLLSAQDVIRIRECNSQTIKQQADSMKALFAKDGFVVMKEASISMESEYEMPVIVP
ncbi:MAG TPA: hypothetical protein VEX63_09555, partial [Flavisolibacter sp.]|nr:hypothetical protein [Flavisolibacter sp.]